MKTQTLRYILIAGLGALACRNPKTALPERASLPDTLKFSLAGFQVSVDADTLEAWVSGPVQTYPLHAKKSAGSWFLTSDQPHGVVEGPASLVLRSGSKQLVKPVWIANAATATGTSSVYFTPKTINLDSAQDLHRMEHLVDVWRNLLALDSGRTLYFDERLIELGTRAGTYRGVADRPLSSYYVHSGSCRDIPVRYRFNDTAGMAVISAGPLTDDWNNEQAGGTLVVFALRQKGKVWRYESRLLQAYASVAVPKEQALGAILQVSVHRTHSPLIELVQN
jgi:hypothetical protein